VRAGIGIGQSKCGEDQHDDRHDSLAGCLHRAVFLRGDAAPRAPRLSQAPRRLHPSGSDVRQFGPERTRFFSRQGPGLDRRIEPLRKAAHLGHHQPAGADLLGDAVGHEARHRAFDHQRLDDQPDGQDQQRRHRCQDECVGPVIPGKGVQKAGVTARACDRLAAAEHVAGGAKDEDDRDDPEKRHGTLPGKVNGRGRMLRPRPLIQPKARLHVAAHGDAVGTTIWVSASSGSATRP
jgi:hypothetical protein